MSHFALFGAGYLLLLASTLRRPSAPTASGSAASATASAAPAEVNQYGESKNNLTLDDWQRRWEKGQTPWHRKDVHPALLAAAPRLRSFPSAPPASAAEAPIIFVPLCGKTVDLVFLYEKGYKVIGVEIATQAITDFFYENDRLFPTFRCEKMGPSARRYVSGEDDRMQLWQVDIFSESLTTALLDVGQGVDAIWDRGSLVAVNPHQRAAYVATLERLSKPSTQLLVNYFQYDQERMAGPPFAVHNIDALFPASKGYVREGQKDLNTTFEVTQGVEAQQFTDIIQKK